MQDGISLFDPATVTVSRYRYRGTKIPLPLDSTTDPHRSLTRRHGPVESRILGDGHVRSGRRPEKRTRTKAWDRAPARPTTYAWTHVGFVYVSFATDVCSRRILGSRVSTAKTTPLVMSALEQALFSRRRGSAAFTATRLIHRSHAGAQYTSLAFTEALLGLCAAESRSGRGWPPADRLVVWVLARARASRITPAGRGHDWARAQGSRCRRRLT